jgi:hypothetical protein
VGKTKDKIRAVRLSITDQRKNPSPSELTKPFLRRSYAIRQCLTDTNPGDVLLSLIVLPEGTIGRMKVEDGYLGSESSSCIFQILKRIPLPRADSPRILELRLLIQ